MSEELYNSNDYCSLAEQYEELKKENAELTADKAHLMNLFMESSEYIFDVVSNMKINDLERKCKALEADYVISNRELLILQQRIAELSQAVGLITTLKPTMVMDANHPLDMAKEVAEYVTARIAELEAMHRWIPVGERLPELDQDVLAIVEGDIVTGHFYQQWDGEIYFSSDDEGAMMVATHWMPQPPEVQR